MPKKTEMEDPLGFFIHSVAKLQKKLKGGPFGGKKLKRSCTVHPLVSSGIVCYAGNHFGSDPWANRYNLA